MMMNLHLVWKNKPCVWETDITEVEALLQWIASGLQNAAEGYLTLASHISKIAPYELPQIVAPNTPTTYGCSYVY